MAGNRDRTIYRITIADRLDTESSAWLPLMTMSTDADDHTILTGPIEDQAALRGVLNRLWDLNLTILSLYLVEED